VLLNDTARDVQAEAHTRESAIVDVPRAVETLEDQRLVFGRNADALVANAEPRVPVFVSDFHEHRRL